MPVADCRGLVLWSVSASRSGANLIVGAAFRVQVHMRNAVHLHVNHARAHFCQGFSYTGSRDRCSYGCQGLEMTSSSVFWVMDRMLRNWLLDCGQDSPWCLLAGRAGSYEVTPSKSGCGPGGGRRIVRRPALVRQPNMGSGRPRELER